MIALRRVTWSEFIYNVSMDSVSDEEIAALMAVATNPRQLEARRRTVEKTFEVAATDAALTIVDLAMNSPNDRIRLDAAKYIVERVAGKIKDDVEDTTPHWEKVIAQGAVYREPSKHELTTNARDIDGEYR